MHCVPTVPKSLSVPIFLSFAHLYQPTLPFPLAATILLSVSTRIWLNSPVKPPCLGLSVVVVEWFLITNSISLLVMGLFGYSISLWLSLGRFLGLDPFQLGYPIHWHTIFIELSYSPFYFCRFCSIVPTSDLVVFER